MLTNLLDKDDCTNVSVKENKQEDKAKVSFKCDDCSNRFLTKSSLKKHMKRYHKVYTAQNIERGNNDPFKNNPNRKLEWGICVLNFGSLEEMDEHMDHAHEGRWKLGDPDVIFEGDDYVESSESEYSSTNSESSESSESQSGEE